MRRHEEIQFRRCGGAPGSAREITKRLARAVRSPAIDETLPFSRSPALLSLSPFSGLRVSGIHERFYLASRRDCTATVQSERRPLTRDASGPGFRSAEPHRFRSTAQPTDLDRRPVVVLCVSKLRARGTVSKSVPERFIARMQGRNTCTRPDN